MQKDAHLKKFVSWFADKRFAPSKMVVNWGLRTVETAANRVAGVIHAPAAAQKPPATGESAQKPPIKAFISSPHQSSRNGTKIQRIILHYTTSDNVDGTLSWFQNPDSRVSAHYIIDQDGDIYQMVRDSEKAFHAFKENADSIGIEHVAKQGQKLTKEQERASVQLIKWLMDEYKIGKQNITGHRFTPNNAGFTDCPDMLFGARTEQALRDWVEKHFGEDDSVTVVIDGKAFTEARFIGDRSFVWIKPVADHFGWGLEPESGSVKLTIDGKSHQLSIKNVLGRGFVASRDLGSILGTEPKWEPAERRVTLATKVRV